LLALFFVPHIGQDTITSEDIKFRAYLEEYGWDTRQMGTKAYQMQRASSVDTRMDQNPVEKV